MPLDYKIRQIAVHVEDHPIEPLDLEGIVPDKHHSPGVSGRWATSLRRPKPTCRSFRV